MKTYLKELRGQVRGNARLRRRLDARDETIRILRLHIGTLVTLLDKAGQGDCMEVRSAAWAIGWTRYTPGIRAEIQRQVEEVMGVRP